ncbi:MAG: hypothetical protein ACX938_12730 [Roseivivax sp.]
MKLYSLVPILVLIGCGPQPDRGPYNTPTPVTNPVAEKALGKGAFHIDPFRANFITTPGIYNVREGQVRQICERDTSLIETISEMRKARVPEERIIEDSLLGASFTVNVLGQDWTYPYRKIKVTGYTIERVFSGDSGSPEDWILKNLGEQCRESVLPRNKPYMVVTGIARAKFVESVVGGGDVGFAFGVGPAVIQGKIAPYEEERETDRIFAVSGDFVPAEDE